MRTSVLSPSRRRASVAQYPKGFQPLRNDVDYHRFYYQLQKNVDEQIGKVIRAITADRSQYRDTVIIYLSDHGEMLGAHGGMFQKWHAAYDEMVRVPFIFHNPELFDGHTTSDIITSHADLIPTMLGLAGLDEVAIGNALKRSHSQVRRLVGNDLSGVLLGVEDGSTLDKNAAYFMTDDQPFKGLNAVSLTGLPYQPVDQPNCVETVITYLPTGTRRSEGAMEVLAVLGQPAVLDPAERARRPDVHPWTGESAGQRGWPEDGEGAEPDERADRAARGPVRALQRHC